MKNKINNKKLNKGFSLLELLVVILIIGVLAAIALPQYKRAVWKSRAANLYTQITPIGSAIQRYYMVHGTWANEFNDLDIDIPLESKTGTICMLRDEGGKSLKRGKDFALKIQSGKYDSVFALFTSGPYTCGGFSYFTGIKESSEKLFCVEIPEGNSFTKERGDFCEKIMGYSFYKNKYGVDWFIN